MLDRLFLLGAGRTQIWSDNLCCSSRLKTTRWFHFTQLVSLTLLCLCLPKFLPHTLIGLITMLPFDFSFFFFLFYAFIPEFVPWPALNVWLLKRFTFCELQFHSWRSLVFQTTLSLFSELQSAWHSFIKKKRKEKKHAFQSTSPLNARAQETQVIFE